MKKLLTLVTALLLAVSCCFGLACGGGGGGGGGLNGDGVDGFEDTVDVGIDEFHSGSLKVRIMNSDAEVAMMNKLIAAFNEKYPDITVTVDKILQENYYLQLGLDRKAGTLGDVFWISQDYIDFVVGYGNIIQPLEKIDDKDTAFSVDALVDESIACSSLKVNGKEHLYMIPRDYNEVVMYYNVDMFEKAGVATPHPTVPMTQAEFGAMVDALRAYYPVSSNDIIVDVNACWDSFSWPLLKSFGATVANSNGDVTFNNNNTKAALTYWRGLYANNIVPNSSTTTSGAEFGMEKAPIYFQARAALGNILTETQGVGVKELGVAPVPNFGGTYCVGGGASGYAINQATKNPSEAWAFLKFIVSEEGQEAMGESGSHVPSLESLLVKQDAKWRTFTNSKLVNFNPDTYLVARNNGAYTTARDFFDYMPVGIQKDILDCISKCFQEINEPTYTAQSLANKISAQAYAMEDIIIEAIEEG